MFVTSSSELQVTPVHVHACVSFMVIAIVGVICSINCAIWISCESTAFLTLPGRVRGGVESAGVTFLSFRDGIITQ